MLVRTGVDADAPSAAVSTACMAGDCTFEPVERTAGLAGVADSKAAAAGGERNFAGSKLNITGSELIIADGEVPFAVDSVHLPTACSSRNANAGTKGFSNQRTGSWSGGEEYRREIMAVYT